MQLEAESDHQVVASHTVSPRLIREDGDVLPKDEPYTLTETAPVPGAFVCPIELNLGTEYDKILVELP